MFDKEYIDVLKSRALALGFDSGYIDEDYIFCIYNNEFCLSLSNYIFYMMKNYPRISVYEIPDGIYGVLVDDNKSCSEIFKSIKKDIKVVTNKDLLFFGSMYNKYSGYSNYIALNYKVTKDFFNHIILDFTKSKRLNILAPYSFCDSTVRGIYFGNGLVRVKNYSFYNANIGELTFTNLKEVESEAFKGCNYIYNLDLGKELTSVMYSGLAFSSIVNEVIFRGIDLRPNSIENVKNVYFYLDYLEDDCDYIIDTLRDISDKLEDGQITKSYSIKMLNKLIDNYKSAEEENNYTINKFVELLKEAYTLKNIDKLLLYCSEIISSMEKIKKNSIKTNFYIYKTDYSIDKYDVHDRNYDKIAENDICSIYIEDYFE